LQEHVNSLDTLEQLSSALEGATGRAIATARPDLLLDAALYMWEAHCKPLLRQIKIVSERHSSSSGNSSGGSGGSAELGATGANGVEDAMSAEQRRRHADGTHTLLNMDALSAIVNVCVFASRLVVVLNSTLGLGFVHRLTDSMSEFAVSTAHSPRI
jgi:hypothetical protein